MICMGKEPELIQCYDIIPASGHFLLENCSQASRRFNSLTTDRVSEYVVPIEDGEL
jgi:hypothetical protein